MGDIIFLNRPRVHMPSVLGTIRMGEVKPQEAKDHGRPTTADTWLITSDHKDALADLAAHDSIGGSIVALTKSKSEVQPGRVELTNSDHKWRLRTSVRELPVIVPPSEEAATQQYEIWKSQTMVRKCDGEMCQVKEARGQDFKEPEACLCRSKGKTCQLKTRAKLLIAEGPLGSWVVRTNNEHEGIALVGSIQTCQMLAANGIMPRAKLGVAWHKGDHGKFPGPVLIPTSSVREFEEVQAQQQAAMIGAGGTYFRPQLETGGHPRTGEWEDPLAEIGVGHGETGHES